MGGAPDIGYERYRYMGIKVKKCACCGQHKRIGKTKSKCKSCRKKFPGAPGFRLVYHTISKKVSAYEFSHAYAVRNRRLKLMGYASYQEYLTSPLWSEIRRKVFARDKGLCVLCGMLARDVHHLDYQRQTMLGKSLDRVVSLCSLHHEVIEMDGQSKRSFPDVAKVFDSLAINADIPYRMARGG